MLSGTPKQPSAKSIEPRVCHRCCGGGQVYVSAHAYAKRKPLPCPDCDGTGKLMKPVETPLAHLYEYTVGKES